ncbi:HK97 family phage portal protein [Rhizomicrobium palustre]|uniref:HK97 family phage portal protein n=1 Tax=Rhizomicrobium palustre TaxID=189966 RepID=A0A846MWN1_9PROT|nr:phage portal protein [Rhizomicrobium palustre]NIK87639.1 HK97 family phage portal protein [Rhizomicrobium palustre]
MLNLFSRFAAEKKAAPHAASPFIALSMIGAPRWSGRDFTSAAREGVIANAVAYRCVRMIAEAAASVPWLLYEGTSEIAAHPLLSLLARPNPHEEGTALFERWYGFLQCAGDSYLEAVSASGSLRELYVLRPDRVVLVADARGWPIAYDYTIEGRTLRLARDATGFLPVLHAKLFHPLDDHYGLSPLAPAGTALDVHNGGAAWTKALLDNAARPSGALVYKGPDGAVLSDEQFSRLKRELDESYTGSANAGRPMVLEGGLDWRSMSYSPAELDFANSRAVAAREIALAFGVPPMLLGIPGDNTYANYREANLVFWRQTVLPLVARTARALTGWLAPRFGENLRLSYDVDAVEALALEREAVWNRLADASFLTLNEKRAAAGYSPVSGGDVF